MSWEWLLWLAPFLLLLACPLAMWWMMKGMGSGDGCARQSGENGPPREAVLEREVALLRARVADLEGGPVRGPAGAGRESGTGAGY